VSDAADTTPPTLRVLRGNPTPAELAAVTAVLAAREAEEAASAAKRTTQVAESAWSASRRPLRSPLHAGPGQWSRHPG
jgi:hypothetical protein